MRILLVHNYYQLPGGEDEVFRRERAMLTGAGHEVREYVRSNQSIEDHSPLVTRIRLARDTLWSPSSEADLAQIAHDFMPEVTHFHNTFPLISPSAYRAARLAGSAVVQSLHNPRLLCPAATRMRQGITCDLCASKIVPWPSVLHRCYKDSLQSSLVAAAYLTFHTLRQTWKEDVDRYIVFTDFYRELFAEYGVPRDALVKKPHFCEDLGEGGHAGGYGIYAGRLAEEKGVGLMLAAWEQLSAAPLLKIRGTGPLLERAQAAERNLGSVALVPWLAREPLVNLMKDAAFLVWPSLGHYETFGLVAIEAFSCGLPVVASRAGAMAELIEDGLTGLLFESGSASDLAAKVAWAQTHPDQMQAMGRRARIAYLERFTRESNYGQLMEIYRQAILVCARMGPSGGSAPLPARSYDDHAKSAQVGGRV